MWMCIDGLKDIACARLGDGQVEKVQIDISAWRQRYPQLADYHVKVFSPGGIAYLPVVTLEEDILTWTITKSDTGVAGRGSYAVLAVGPGEAQKSTPSGIFEVKAGMAEFQTEEPLDPAKPWVNTVLEAAERAEEAADRAESSGGALDEERVAEVAIEAVKPYITWEQLEGKPFGTRDDGSLDFESVTVNVGAEKAGRLFYADTDGNIVALALGEGLAIVDGVLVLTGAVVPEEIAGVVDENGDFTVTGYAVQVDEDGNVTIPGLAALLDENGNVTFEKE